MYILRRVLSFGVTVTLGEESNVWFNAVIRADREPVIIGKGTIFRTIV